jgi:hypothetical protein
MKEVPALGRTTGRIGSYQGYESRKSKFIYLKKFQAPIQETGDAAHSSVIEYEQ